MSELRYKLFTCTLIAILSQLGLCSGYEPVLSQNEDVQLICLLDIHKSQSSIDSTCTDFRPKTMFVALTALWKWNTISNSSESGEKIGLTVYDTCGSEKRAIQILSGYLAKSVSTRSIAGVITYASPEVTSAVHNMLRHMDVLHVQITDRDVPSCRWDDFESCLSFPIHSDARAEAAIQVSGLLDWTYMSALGLTQQSDQSDLDTFLNLTKDGSICIASTHELLSGDLVLSSLPEVKANAAVLFTGDSIIPAVPETSSTLMIVSTETSSLTNENNNVLFLLEDIPRLDGMVEYLYGLVNNNVTINIQGGYLLTDSDCFRDTGQNKSKIQLKCLSLLKTNYGNLAMADAVSFVHGMTTQRMQTNCSDNIAECSNAKQSLTFINDVMSFFTYNGRKIVHKRRTFSLVFPRNRNNRTEIVHIGNIETPVEIPTTYYDSHCGDDACFECKKCRPSFSSDERVMFNDANIILVGVFPIHTSSLDRKCSVPNVRGFKLAQAFTNAIQMLSEKNLTLYNNITFGGVVFDSCGDETWFLTKYHEIENCLYHYKDSNDRAVVIQPSKTVAYFNIDDFSGFNTITNTAKISLTISDTGIYFGNSAIDHYTISVSRTLKEIKWTYIYLIVSDVEILKNKADEFKMKLTEHGICLGEVIILKHNSSGDLHDKSLSALKDAEEDAGTFLLLTSEHDTKQIFTNLLNKPVPKVRLKLLIFSWHLHLLQNNLEGFIEDVIILWPKLQTSALPGVRSVGNPWYEQFQDPLASNGSATDVLQLLDARLTLFMTQAVENLVSSLATVHSNRCPRQQKLCRDFTDFLSLKHEVEPLLVSSVQDLQDELYINKIQFRDGELVVQKIGELSTTGDIALFHDRPIVLPAPSQCKGWCSKCRRCQPRAKPDDQTLYHQGDILLGGVFPIHQRGLTSFKCGIVSGTLGSDRAVEAFMYAIESSQTRYPYLLPSVSVGGLVFDSCSDSSHAVQSIGNFESCVTSLSNSSSWTPDPSSNIGYVLDGGEGVNEYVWRAIRHTGKMVVATDADGNELHTLSEEPSSELEAISSVLSHLNWTDVIVLATNSTRHVRLVQSFLLIAAHSNLCVLKTFYFNHYNGSSLNIIARELTHSQTTAVVVMAQKQDTLKLFQHNGVIRYPRPWLVSVTNDDWRTMSDVHFPYGSILLDKKGKFSTDFEEFSLAFKITDSNITPWWKQYWQERFQCKLPGVSSRYDAGCPPTYDSRHEPSTVAAKIIKGVDLMLHSIHDRYVELCPSIMGLCARFLDEGVPALPAVMNKIRFEFEQELVRFTKTNKLDASYLISSHQPHGTIKIGEWHDFHLQLDFNKVRFYDNNGDVLPSKYSQCYEDCGCLNINTTEQTTEPLVEVLDPARFSDTSGEFTGVLWATVILAIAASGAFISFMLMLYVLYKVCSGALVKRHVWLGFVLLAGVMLLYLSVIPFTFTPSEGVCGLRYFAPGFSYALCFSSILVKLTSLRDYRLIGLGGEVSNLNQMLSVLFVSGVQIAVGVQYWVQNTPMLLTQSFGSEVMFACDFQKNEFAVYLVYIMILIVTCSVYGIGVRNERKNMGEVRLLLACSWLCIVVWVAWLVVFFVLDTEYTDASICIAILACSTLMLVGIFIPKIHLVSRLKYDVSKHASGNLSNGYKVDPDFFFERPYSLPGTMTSTYSSVKTFPKSITHFDSSMSY